MRPPGTAEPLRPASARQLDKLELAALAYLLIPLALFIVSWLRWPAAMAMAALLGLSTWAVVRQARARSGEALPWRLWFLLAAVAALWVALSGLAGGLPLNKDWGVRMVVLRDLTVGDWPVGYGPADGGQMVLRFSLGYYLVPAVAGKLFGVEGARMTLAVWTLGGVMLFFALIVGNLPERGLRSVATALGMLVLFSGMDSVGWWMYCACLPSYGQHIEWWNPLMQYSAQTTLLFWVPNHALPAWLLVGVVWRHRDDGLALAPAAVLMLAAALWSPLACVGLTPLLMACSVRGQSMRAWLKELVQPAVMAVMPTTLLLGKFVTFGMPRHGSGDAASAAADGWSLTAAPVSWLLEFAMLEWGFLALMLVAVAGGARRLPWYFWVAVVELAVLPLTSFGPGNDLVMRGGIAPMTVLLLTIAAALRSPATPVNWRHALWGVLLLGSVTPLLELQRATLPGSHWPDDGRNLLAHVGRPWHYVGILTPGWMQSVLRTPVPLATPSSKAGDGS